MSKASRYSIALSIVLTASMTFVAEAASAGGRDGGGGVGFVCENGVLSAAGISTSESTYLADTYPTLYRSSDSNFRQKIKNLNQAYNADPEEAFTVLFLTLKKVLNNAGEQELATELEAAKDHLRFVQVSGLGNEILPRVLDDHIPVSAIPCLGGKLVQLARQQDGVVEIVHHENLLGELQPIEYGLLKLHEVRLRWMIEKGYFQEDTTPVRSWVAKLTTMDFTELLQEHFVSDLRGYGGTFIGLGFDKKSTVELNEDISYTISATQRASESNFPGSSTLPTFIQGGVCSLNLQRDLNHGAPMQMTLSKGARYSIEQINPSVFVWRAGAVSYDMEIYLKGPNGKFAILCDESKLGANPTLIEIEQDLGNKIKFDNFL